MAAIIYIIYYFNVFAELRLAYKNKFIYYIYINRVLNVIKIFKIKNN